MVDRLSVVAVATLGDTVGEPELIAGVDAGRRDVDRILGVALGREPIIEEVDRGARRRNRVVHHVIGCSRRCGIAEAEQRRKIVQRVRNRRLRHNGRRKRDARERRCQQMSLSPRAMRAVVRFPLPPYPKHVVPPNYVARCADGALLLFTYHAHRFISYAARQQPYVTL